jgi:hypothetical protein
MNVKNYIFIQIFIMSAHYFYKKSHLISSTKILIGRNFKKLPEAKEKTRKMLKI